MWHHSVSLRELRCVAPLSVITGTPLHGTTQCLYGNSAVWHPSVSLRELRCVAPLSVFTGTPLCGTTQCHYGNSAVWHHSVSLRALRCVSPIVVMTLFTGRESQALRAATLRSSTAKRTHRLRHFGKINYRCLFRKTPSLEIKMTLVWNLKHLTLFHSRKDVIWNEKRRYNSISVVLQPDSLSTQSESL